MATIEVHEMTYHIIETIDGGYDVRDVAGSRPIALRAVGPWDTEAEAVAAVEAMTAAEARE